MQVLLVQEPHLGSKGLDVILSTRETFGDLRRHFGGLWHLMLDIHKFTPLFYIQSNEIKNGSHSGNLHMSFMSVKTCLQ